MLRLADPFGKEKKKGKKSPSFVLLLLFFFINPVLASEATRGQFPSASCVGRRNKRARQTE